MQEVSLSCPDYQVLHCIRTWPQVTNSHSASILHVLPQKPKWRNCHHRLHQMLPECQLPLKPGMKISSKWCFSFTDESMSSPKTGESTLFWYLNVAGNMPLGSNRHWYIEASIGYTALGHAYQSWQSTVVWSHYNMVDFLQNTNNIFSQSEASETDSFQ